MTEDEMIILSNGALPDDRPEDDKLKDFKFEEMVAAANPVAWGAKPQESWRRFPIFSQNGSGSCVAQTEAKELGIMQFLRTGTFVPFSATHIYQRRKNRPAGGMIAADARDILRKGGATLEALLPSQNMTDKQMDAAKAEPYMEEVATVFRAPNYVELPTGDIDAIASVIQTTGKGVMIWCYFSTGEWTDTPQILKPTLGKNDKIALRHSITAIDFFILNGKKCLLIDDSWSVASGIGGQRIITEDFFAKRNWYSSYLVNFKYEEGQPPAPVPTPDMPPAPVSPNKPKYKFTSALTFGQNGPAIRALQDILRFEGLFPANIASTGYYGAITARGVLNWQKKYAVAPLAELSGLQGRRVGDKTINKLNQLYA
jgi:hypothetical protein